MLTLKTANSHLEHRFIMHVLIYYIIITTLVVLREVSISCCKCDNAFWMVDGRGDGRTSQVEDGEGS